MEVFWQIESVTFIPLGLHLQKWQNKHSWIPLKVRKHLMLERFEGAKNIVL